MKEPLLTVRQVDAPTLKRERLRRGFSQQSLADKAGISRSYLADIERGRKSPRNPVLEAIAEALGVPSVRLLDNNTE